MTDHQRHSRSIALTLGLAISLLNALPSLAQATPPTSPSESPKVPAPAAEVGGTTSNPPPPPNNGWIWLLLLPLGGGITWWALQKREPSDANESSFTPSPPLSDQVPNQTLHEAAEPIDTESIDTESIDTVQSPNQNFAQNANVISNSIFPESLEPSVNLIESNDLTQSNVEAAKYDLGYHSETSGLPSTLNLNQTNDLTQSVVEASKYNLGYVAPLEPPAPSASELSASALSALELLASAPSTNPDSHPPEVTSGDNSPKIVFISHDAESGYLNWDMPNQARQALEPSTEDSLTLHERMFRLSWPATGHLGSSQYHEASPKIIPQDDWF
jgi:hypothetical protein